MLSIDVSDLKVLIIEDNLHFRTFLKSLLQALGVNQVREARDGQEAMDILKEFPADLATLDQKMAGVSGLEFVAMVRDEATSPAPFLPIIMMTGNTDAELLKLASDAGVNDFVTKPVSAMSFLARIQSVLENKRPFVRSSTYFGPDRRLNYVVYEGDEKRIEITVFIIPS
jgi:two-component system, chemotaxis family, chemotaxis protein CheY